jgi:hypothetical protein
MTFTCWYSRTLNITELLSYNGNIPFLLLYLRGPHLTMACICMRRLFYIWILEMLFIKAAIWCRGRFSLGTIIVLINLLMLLDLFLSFRAFERLLDIFSVRLFLSDIFPKLNIWGGGGTRSTRLLQKMTLIKLKAIAGQYV